MEIVESKVESQLARTRVLRCGIDGISNSICDGLAAGKGLKDIQYELELRQRCIAELEQLELEINKALGIPPRIDEHTKQ